LRPGHNSSSSSEERFESTIDSRSSLMRVEQSQLVDQHCSKSEAGGVNPALGGDLTVHIEDGLEMLIEVLIGQATQFVEDAPNLYSGIGVRVGSSFGGDQKPLCPLAFVAYVLGVVLGISQNEACLLLGQLLDQPRSHLVVRHISRGEPRREWDPHPATVMARCSFHP